MSYFECTLALIFNHKYLSSLSAQSKINKRLKMGWAMGCWLLAAAHYQSSCAGALGLVCGLRFAACGLRGCWLCWLLDAGCTGCSPATPACGLRGLWAHSLSVACCVWLVACGLLVGWLWFSCGWLALALNLACQPAPQPVNPALVPY
jgi:hypothetical protein